LYTVQNYHQHCDKARGLTAGLCALLAVAVVGTIVVSAALLAGVIVSGSFGYLSVTTNVKMPFGHWYDMYLDRFRDAGVLTTLLVAATAVYKSYQLAEGGGRLVAISLGGSRVSDADADPGRCKLRNVVERLAIATGLRTPPVYVLENESAINAFAAGYNAKDAVVGVTRGAVDRLEHHQLQGVVAHEFSHILNGDMRLNIRLLGLLTGIQTITFVANYLIRLGLPSFSGATRGAGGGKHPLGMALALVFGIVIWPIGQVGSLFALLITSAVNRQREFLADASAVQITGDPAGLREALIIALREEVGSRVKASAAKLASHMFFAAPRRWQWLLATHPPLQERIQRLDAGAATRRQNHQSRNNATVTRQPEQLKV
jgi:Zn-dependent protease with chaperone function